MSFSKIMTAMLLISMGVAKAAEVYTEARITQIEQNDAYIILFLGEVSETPPPTGNGSSNEPHPNNAKPLLFLASSPSDISNRKHLLSAAITALSLGSKVRFRWEDGGTSPGRIHTMLIRQ